MTLDFLSRVPARPGAVGGAPPDAGDGAQVPVARSPMERSAAAAGAVFEVRDGWNVAVSYGATAEQEAAAAARSAGWADVSHLGKLELQGPADALDAIATHCGAALALGEATRAGDAWWCRLTASRALVVGDTAALRERIQAAVAEAEGSTVVDVGTNFAALTLTGPQAREVLARFCALDLRPSQTPVRGLRPGSIGRQPGILICEAPDRFLFMFGWATAEYMWSIVTDAGSHLGGRPIGIDALAELPEPAPAAEAANA